MMVFLLSLFKFLIPLGKEVELNPDAEEVASFFAALLGTDHAANPTFKSNFFKDFLAICKRQKEVCVIPNIITYIFFYYSHRAR